MPVTLTCRGTQKVEEIQMCSINKLSWGSKKKMTLIPGLGNKPGVGSTAQSFFPLAACSRSRKVFGYFPSPQILNDPKSLYQGPSGASGSDSRHIFSWYKSSAVIFRLDSLSKR